MNNQLYKDIERKLELGVDIADDSESELYKQQVLKEFKATSRQQLLERKYFKGKKCLPIGVNPVFLVEVK